MVAACVREVVREVRVEVPVPIPPPEAEPCVSAEEVRDRPRPPRDVYAVAAVCGAVSPWIACSTRVGVNAVAIYHKASDGWMQRVSDRCGPPPDAGPGGPAGVDAGVE